MSRRDMVAERDRLRRLWAAGEASASEIDRCHQLELCISSAPKIAHPDSPVERDLFFHRRRRDTNDRRPLPSTGIPRCQRYGCGRLFTAVRPGQVHCEACLVLPSCVTCHQPHDPGAAAAAMAGRCGRCYEEWTGNASGRRQGVAEERRPALSIVRRGARRKPPAAVWRLFLRRVAAAWFQSNLPVPSWLRPALRSALVRPVRDEAAAS